MLREYLIQLQLISVVLLDFVAWLPTNIAEVLLVLNYPFLVVSQLGKCISHQARNNVAEQRTEKDSIDDFVGKGSEVGFICLALLNEYFLVVDHQETGINGAAVFLTGKRSIRFDCEDGKHHEEAYAQESEEEQLVQVHDDSHVDIGECLDSTEQIEDVDAVVVWAD